MTTQTLVGELHKIPIVQVDEDIVAEARGLFSLKKIVVGNDYAALTPAEQRAVLEHEAAHCIGYHTELRYLLAVIVIALVWAIGGWTFIGALAAAIGGLLSMKYVAHTQEYAADLFAADRGQAAGMRAFLKRCKSLPPSELHPSPRARLRALKEIP